MIPENAKAGHPDIATPKVGVLIVNLGTPDGTDYRSMRRYLKEFLSDRRVIEVNPVVWWLILNGPVLTFRPSKSAKAYEQIWNREKDESPLRTVTRAQCEKLQEAMGRPETIVVDWAMRYGKPAIGARLEALKACGCERIVIFPLYPQYCSSTTASVNDKAFEALKAMRWQPAIRTVPPYHDDAAYIEALANSLKSHIAGLGWTPEVVLASFHGLPQAYFDKGDPYHCHCAKTTRLLREKMGWDEKRLFMTFQSRFGKAEWLKPYTEQTVRELARSGVRRLAVIMPGFAADCVETLEEIAIGIGEVFEHEGGENFAAVPCLNDSREGITMLAEIAGRELEGWA